VVDTIKALENLAVSKSIQVVVNLPEVGIPLEADPDKMEQVYINLLGNAIKFTPPKGLITVGARLETKDGRPGVLGWVKDTGPGIPPEEAEKVFEMFYQIDNTRDQMVLGTGLGLTICRRIVEAHGGRIWVESAVGQGACFKFLPTWGVKQAWGNLPTRRSRGLPGSPNSHRGFDLDPMD
jgi:signal transduction histidine kinase